MGIEVADLHQERRGAYPALIVSENGSLAVEENSAGTPQPGLN